MSSDSVLSLRALGMPDRPESKAIRSGVTWTGPDTAHMHWIDELGGHQPEQLVASIAYGISVYCFTAMQWRATRMAAAPLMVVRETPDSGVEWQPRHPLARILMQPRPDIHMGEMLEKTQMYRDWTGGALWVTDRDNVGRLSLVSPFSALEFETEAEGVRIFGKYRVRDRHGQMQPVPLEQVVHFREANPGSWRKTVSRVDVALQQLNLGHEVNRIVQAFLRQALFPGGIISPDKDWQASPQEWKEYKAAVMQYVRGKQGGPLVLPGGTSVEFNTQGMQGLLPEDIVDRVEACVGSAFGTPPVVLGWLSGMKNSPWSQMGEARRQVYEDTIQPLWADYENRLTAAWLTPEEQDAGFGIRFDTSRIVALKADAEAQARIGVLAEAVLKVNERRRMLGEDPLPDDDPRGEEIVGLRPAVVVPDSLGAGPDPEPPEEVDEEEEEEEPGKGLKANPDTKDLLWLVFDIETKAAEGAWERSIYAHLQDLRARVLKAAERTLGGKADEVTASMGRSFQLALEAILDQDRPKLQAKTYPLLVGTGGKAVRRLGSRLRLSFSVLEPGLLKYARAESAFLAKVMGQTTGDLVAKAVQAGLEAGETLRPLMKRLEQLEAFTRDRAKMVARTESTRAWNGAQQRSMSDYQQRTGKKATKSWLSSRDSRVREEHAALDDGKFYPIDATFDNGLQAPGEPNCRCTMLYGLEDTRLEDTTP